MAELLAGKVIVVAGAGGIGDVLARRYADEGARVVALTEEGGAVYRCDRAWIAQIAHGRLEVDDWFGWQIGYSGGADVLDVGDEPGCEQRFEVVAFLLALHGPGGVGVDEIDGPGRPVLLAAHREGIGGRRIGRGR